MNNRMERAVYLRVFRFAVAVFAGLCVMQVRAAGADSAIEAVRQDIDKIRQAYESRIQALETRLQEMEGAKTLGLDERPVGGPATAHRTIRDNSFNPSIGAVLSGRAQSFSRKTSELAGFAIGEEGERGSEGLSLDETEINFSASADDKFRGSLTAAIVQEDGADIIELEEAYIQTLAGLGLPDGLRIKAGRAFWTFGYLNEHHGHADDFADRPLTNRVYLNSAYNDIGVEASYVLPTDFYSEIGVGAFRGDDFPAGGSVSGVGAYSGFARVGGDIGANQSWRLGGYGMLSDAVSRSANEDEITFSGKSNLFAADMRYTWAPTGNPKNQEVILQGEYFYRVEDGTYNAGSGAVGFDDHSHGFYAQGIYKFDPAWRVGARYSQLFTADVPAGLAGTALDSSGHDPSTISFMADWTNSEFGRVRLQYNREKPSDGVVDNQFLVQYIVSIGAHGAHAY
tara:strand:- start:2010 stop:3374 length:1365 start_codon:yes stop_codon:yes gene_type:complete